MRSFVSGVLFLHFLLLVIPHISCWNDEALLLRDVQVLTLHRGRYTTARRSSPVLQLQCVGGSAGCGSFVPEVVQCYNRGSDGIDTQWECKADMDNAYRFGRVEVSCEGYNSPNDAYVLRGSCGLEYTLELTAEGRQQHTHGSKGSSGFSDFASNFFQGFSNHKQQQSGGHSPQSNGPSVLLTATKVTEEMDPRDTAGHGITARVWSRRRLDSNQIITQKTIPAQGPGTAFLTSTPDLRVLGLVSLVETPVDVVGVDSGLEWAQVEFWDICLGIRDASHPWASQAHLTTTHLLQHQKQAQEHGPPQVLEELKEDD
ncbi:store-operated calcium entry-associated regulatory factor-like isoform X2 [Cyprinus carpio]|uniref:Store-operated calcium entry-associated regulatory factor n=1 Tax=Cyprinus carpio TaxID=7962 RepID=A0A9Q9ZTU7_CYPCA|nr:store-operated calcium entry-associated regulatory factor-like isoform X2 [Cyprinus carpio]